MSRLSTVLAAAALCCCATLAQAAAFDPIAQQRLVSIAGNATVVDTDTGATWTDAHSDSRSTAASDFGPSALDVGMGLHLDTPGGSVYDDGHTHLASTLGADRIAFEGQVDVNASGYTDYPFYANAYGNSHVDFEYRFSVARDTPVLLAMNSATSVPYSDEYRFLLARADGSIVWNATVVADANGDPQTSFSEGLVLGAGAYTLTASLHANSYFDSGSGSSGRASADFTLSAVPEPSTLALSAAGLGLLALRRRHRLHSARSGEAA
jgi:hypothetical protein